MRLSMIRISRLIKDCKYSVLGFYYRQLLKWGYKGKKDSFENYLKFQEAPIYAKFMWYDEEAFRVAQDPEYRAKRELESRLAMAEFDKINPIFLMNPTSKKSVRQTIKDSILELKNQKELGLPE
jgi:hypothetical protein